MSLLATDDAIAAFTLAPGFRSAATACGLKKSGALDLALEGGDDYELCFAVPPGRLAELSGVAGEAGCSLRCIGVLTPEPGLRLLRAGKILPRAAAGYDHFTNPG